jgi:serine/threonine-protein kinase
MQGKVYLGRYRVLRLLGEGGMGRVYLARQLDLNREVVIKVMHEHVAVDNRFQEHFLTEMQAMAQFQHPYAVALYDAQVDPEDGPCIVMEYVKGKTLDMLLKENKRFTPERASRILSQICEVLQAAHAQGIVHRDLKPSNLMILDPDSQYEKIKVMDFGLAKFTGGPVIKQGQAAVESGSDYMLGTPAYVSPEQARGEETNYRTDLYSVGVILYELLTGRLPFDGMSTMDTLLAHAIEQPPVMSNEEISIPPAIERVVMQCLAKRLEDRPASARDLYKSYMDALTAVDPITGLDEVQTSVATNQVAPPPLPDVLDPATMAFQMQAWMPKAVASYKLTGYIHDVRGELIESMPGKLRVLLGGAGMAYSATKPGWFGFSKPKPDIEMELQLYESTDPKHKNNVWISVILRYVGKRLQLEWRDRGEQIFRDLRGYLIGMSPDQN